ncbi:MAG: preprotein translocase subunit SecG [Bryobacteraceae bacterium]
MTILLTIVHVIVCVFLVIVVLLQSGKAADLAGAFGGMGSQTAFGPRGAATVLSKATTISAALFMITSLSLSVMATRRADVGSSVLENEKGPVQQQSAPATPPPAPGGPPAGQPSVTLGPEGGAQQTVPLDIEKLPKVDPNQQKQQPKQQPAPAK